MGGFWHGGKLGYGGELETSECLVSGGGNDMIRWNVRNSGVPLAVAVLAGLAAPAWADYESA